jgi:hypothetical protein
MEQQDGKDLMQQRIHTRDKIMDDDVAKLQSLHLDSIRDKHGPDTVAAIKKDSRCLLILDKRKAHKTQP